MARPIGHGRQPIRTTSTDSVTAANGPGASTDRHVVALGAFVELQNPAEKFDIEEIMDWSRASMPGFYDLWPEEMPPITSREEATSPSPHDGAAATSHLAPSEGDKRAIKRKRQVPLVATDSQSEKLAKRVKAKRSQPCATTTSVDDPIVTHGHADGFRNTTLHRNLGFCKQASQLRQGLLGASTHVEALDAMKTNQGNPANGTTQRLMAQLGAQSSRARNQFAVMLLANMQQFGELTLPTFQTAVMPHLEPEWDSEMEPIRRQATECLSNVLTAAKEINPRRSRRREPPLIDAMTLQELRNLKASWENVGA